MVELSISLCYHELPMILTSQLDLDGVKVNHCAKSISKSTVNLFESYCLNELLSVLWHCWLGIRKSSRPVKNWVMRCWHGYMSGERCRWFAYGVADTTATPSSLAPVISRLV